MSSPSLPSPAAPTPSPMRRLGRGVGTVGLLAVAVAAAVVYLGQALAAAGHGPDFGVGYMRRFEVLRVPRHGEQVDVFAGTGVAVVGYLTYAEVFTPYRQAVVDRAVRRRVDLGALGYNLAQQALAPRLLVLPNNPLYQHTKLVVGNYERPGDVPDMTAAGLQPVRNGGNGTVLWKRR